MIEDRRAGRRTTLLWLTLYGIAMAYLEAAVVVYLRRIYYSDNLLSLFPLKIWESADLLLELAREGATLVMIAAVAALAAGDMRRRIAAFFFVFGVWDLFYYFWLKVTIGWPSEWLEWDILFLIPWAWLAPWVTPAAVAILYTLWGGWAFLTHRSWRFAPASLAALVTGAAVVLYTFLAPAIPLLGAGPEALRSFEPGGFMWAPCTAGLLLLSLGMYLTAAASRPRGGGGQ